MWNSTDVGSVAAMITNSLLMSVPWLFYFSAAKKNKNIGFFTLIASWLTFEYIHLNWQISWPWLTLGNGFAMHTSVIQWYEYTGVAGGSFWILLMNILVYKLVVTRKEKLPIKKNIVQIVSCFIVPVVCSNLILSYQKTLNSVDTSSPASTQNVLVVQPNIDPYQKFEISSASSQIAALVTATESNMDSATTLVLWPETAMSVADWQDNITTNPYDQPVFELSKRYPEHIKIMNKYSFFYPLWNNIENILFNQDDNNLTVNKGEYKDIINNNYCIHLWDTYSHNYLKNINEENIYKNDTLYNIIARKFIKNKISIVFLTYNRYDMTVDCLNSYLQVLDNDYIEELIVLDNNSNKDLTDYEIAKSVIAFKNGFPNKSEYANTLGISRQDLYRLLSFEKLPLEIQQRLDNSPTLLTAKTAEQIGQFIKNNDIASEKMVEILNEVLDLVLTEGLKQNSILNEIEIRVKGNKGNNIKNGNRTVKIFAIDVKKVGQIKKNLNKTTIEFNNDILDQHQQAIEKFFETLISS
jgi:hypothetical protein